MNNEISELINKLGLTVNDISPFTLALTHPSYNVETKNKHSDYERLEFLGDSVIGFVSADLIYKLHPEMDQGNMSKLRSNLVKTNPLANYARELELYKYIKTGHSISGDQLYKSNKILEDVFEALTGAIYLSCGIDTAYEFVKKFIVNGIINVKNYDLVDPKTRLQEDIQAEYRDAVQYTLINEEGPAHDRTFFVEVSFNGIVLGRGSGKSKKAAEEEAARDALSKRVL